MDSKYIPYAQRLANIIQTKKRIYHTPSQIESWAGSIRRLVENCLVGTKTENIARVRKALAWYRTRIGEPYIPVIESGSSLLSKFSKLEEAMSREEYKPSGKGITARPGKYGPGSVLNATTNKTKGGH